MSKQLAQMALSAKAAETYSATAILCVVAKFFLEDGLYIRLGRGLKEHIAAALRPRCFGPHRVLTTTASCESLQPEPKRQKVWPEEEFDIFRHFFEDNTVGGNWRYHGGPTTSSSASS